MRRALTICVASIALCAPIAQAADPDHFKALADFQAVLEKDPANCDALRGKIQTLARLGAPRLALELADRHPGILTPSERDAIAADRTAYMVRWGGISADAGRGTARFADIDRALADSDSAGARALDPAAELSATGRQLALDRIGALRIRFRMREAVALYEAMAARPAAVPAYVKSDAASAYLYLQQPQKARDLYRAALADDPASTDTGIGLYWALVEAEEHDAALAQIDKVVAATPPWIDAWSAATTRENPAYAGVLSSRAMAPLIANRPGEAWRGMRALTARAPFNMNVRTDYASSMRARGWPRRAEEELRWVLAINPDSIGALGERAGALREMRDYRGAEAALRTAQAGAAENGRVVRAARFWEVHNLRQLVIDANSGRSAGGPNGTRDYGVEMHLYSNPIDYNYRFFGHTYNAQARFAEGTGRRSRIGAGVEYRSPRFVADAELSHELNDGGAGVAASLAYMPDDLWTLRGTVDTSSNHTPLRASRAGIGARRVSGEAAWQANESRGASVSFAQMDFSDGNRRDTMQARWTERVISGPVYKLEITASLYGSRNSRVDAPYFNPSRDYAPALEFANEWLQWRRYTRAFRHRVVIGVGSYWQRGFGSGSTLGARYEQEWEADDRLTVRYGIGRSVHPYDGERNTRDYGYVSLNWRF